MNDNWILDTGCHSVAMIHVTVHLKLGPYLCIQFRIVNISKAQLIDSTITKQSPYIYFITSYYYFRQQSIIMAVVIPEWMLMLKKYLDCLFYNRFIGQFWCLSASECFWMVKSILSIFYLKSWIARSRP